MQSRLYTRLGGGDSKPVKSLHPCQELTRHLAGLALHSAFSLNEINPEPLLSLISRHILHRVGSLQTDVFGCYRRAQGSRRRIANVRGRPNAAYPPRRQVDVRVTGVSSQNFRGSRFGQSYTWINMSHCSSCYFWSCHSSEREDADKYVDVVLPKRLSHNGYLFPTSLQAQPSCLQIR
jgi:hypothetical protein